MWQRRAFLKAAGAGFAASLLPQRAEALATAELLYASAIQSRPGHYGAVVLTEEGQVVTSVDLPVRGHDVSFSPIARRGAVFARRPGTLALIFDPDGQAAPVTIATPEDRHFFGHGAFSTDGALLYATENDFAANRGIIGIYEVAGGYKRIGEFPSYGIGPHEVILLPDGKTLAVANGGIETHPDFGRSELNLDMMDPSLAFIDARDGHLIGQLRLAADLHKLSIRHMAVDARNRIWFGCQFRGEVGQPQLVGYASLDGDISLIDLPSDALASLGNYVGGLAISSDLGTIAVSSPVGGAILTIDVASARAGEVTLLDHTCGAAPGTTGFLATNGLGEMVGLAGSTTPDGHFGFQFDEHLRVLRG